MEGIAHQVAALPVRRRRRDGGVEVLLVTSRDTGRWIVPKGWPMPDREDHLAAAQEAQEEAGAQGTASATAIGSYVYKKRRKTGDISVRVAVYLLEVETLLKDWPERRHRRRAWFSPAKAAALVHEPDLQRLLQTLALGTHAT